MSPCPNCIRQPLLRSVMATRFVNVWARKLENRVLTWILVVMSSTVSEGFFLLVVPITCWCVNLTFGRHMLILAALSLFLGNVLKNLLELPRPVDIDISTAWHTERGYGFPSTHALTAVLLPCLVFLNYPALRLLSWYIGAVIWATSIVFSRVYLGVHSVPDVVSGIILGFLFAFGYHFGVETYLDEAITAAALQCVMPIIVILAGALCVWFHPDPNPGSSTLDESAVCMGATASAYLCLWRSSLPNTWLLAAVPPDTILRSFARVLLGMFLLLAIKILSKKLLMLLFRPVYNNLPASKPASLRQDLLAVHGDELLVTRQKSASHQHAIKNWQKAKGKIKVTIAVGHPFFHDMYETVVEEKWLQVSVKYFNYMIVGIAALDTIPYVFSLIGI